MPTPTVPTRRAPGLEAGVAGVGSSTSPRSRGRRGCGSCGRRRASRRRRRSSQAVEVRLARLLEERAPAAPRPAPPRAPGSDRGRGALRPRARARTSVRPPPAASTGTRRARGGAPASPPGRPPRERGARRRRRCAPGRRVHAICTSARRTSASRGARGRLGGPDRTLRHRAPPPPAGCCCVTQCQAPPPVISARARSPTTFAAGEERAQDLERARVVRVAVHRDHHDAVRDVPVGVARRQPVPVELQAFARQRQLHDVERVAVGACAARAGSRGCAASDRSWRRAGCRPPRRRSCGRRRSARWCRRGRRCGRPRGPRRATPRGARRGRRAAAPRTRPRPASGLRVGVRQAGAGGDEQPLVVHLDGAALEHVRQREAAHPQVAGDRFGGAVVAFEGVLAAPRVEAPVGRGDGAVAVDHEGRTVVAEPGVVERHLVEAHARQVGAGGGRAGRGRRPRPRRR